MMTATTGEKLCRSGVKLSCIYGSTEFGGPTNFITLEGVDFDADYPQWSWMQMNPLWTHRWVPQGDGTYELQFLV